MKTSIEKLDHANWLRQILNGTSESVTGISRKYTAGGHRADNYETLYNKHPRVMKFQGELEKLVSDMREDLQAELDGLFK